MRSLVVVKKINLQDLSLEKLVLQVYLELEF